MLVVAPVVPELNGLAATPAHESGSDDRDLIEVVLDGTIIRVRAAVTAEVLTAIVRPVDVHAYADRIVITQDGERVGEHLRRFGRDQIVYDPWHYVPVLARKPGALRNGAPFKDWLLPGSIERVRRKLKGSSDGDKQMVKVLSAVLTDGLQAVEAACAESLAAGVASADVILNVLARQHRPEPVPPIQTPERLILTLVPVADCARYDRLRILPLEVAHGTP